MCIPVTAWIHNSYLRWEDWLLPYTFHKVRFRSNPGLICYKMKTIDECRVLRMNWGLSQPEERCSSVVWWYGPVLWTPFVHQNQTKNSKVTCSSFKASLCTFMEGGRWFWVFDASVEASPYPTQNTRKSQQSTMCPQIPLRVYTICLLYKTVALIKWSEHFFSHCS